jgi:hypothetical protein
MRPEEPAMSGVLSFESVLICVNLRTLFSRRKKVIRRFSQIFADEIQGNWRYRRWFGPADGLIASSLRNRCHSYSKIIFNPESLGELNDLRERALLEE